MRLLVVEDDAGVRECIQEVLELEGYTVDLAEDGQAGLRALERDQSYSAILLDLVMPNMNGFQFLEHLRDRHIGIPVVVCTAASFSAAAKELARSHVPFLYKPFEIHDLIRAVNHCQEQAAASQ